MLYRSGNDVSPAQQKQLLADLLAQTNATDTYPASLAQQRLWFLDQIQHESSAYNIHLGLWLRGPLVPDSLRGALQELVNRHDSLRTAFRLEGGSFGRSFCEALRECACSRCHGCRRALRCGLPFRARGSGGTF